MKTALFIDDDENYLYLMERLHKKGAISNLSKMFTAPHGQQALEMLAGLPASEMPDVMFVDINMPVMDGHEFLAQFSELRKKDPKYLRVIPVVVVTSSTSPSDKDRVAKIEFVENYVVKDIQLQELAIKINELLV